MGNLSDKLSSLTFTPAPQSPFKAGAIVQVASDDITAWQQANWFLCDGTEYAEADYAQLFTAIGSKYNTGGETASYFRVPNGPRESQVIELDVTGTNWTTTRATGKFFQDTLGVWKVDLNIMGSLSVGTATPTVAVAGLVFKNVAAFYQALSGSQTSGGDQLIKSLTVPNTDDIEQQWTGPIGSPSWSGVVELESKPSDTVVGADARFSTFDEALESQPMIKVYNDASNIAMSLSDATASLTGAVRLSSDFAAGDGSYGFVQSNKFQRKDLTTDITTNTTITQLTFNNLNIGSTYSVQGQALFVVNSASSDSFAAIDVVHDSVTLQRVSSHDRQTVSTGGDSNTHSFSVKFVATATTLTFVSSSVSAASYINGTNDGDTFAILTEENNTVVTTDFT